MALRKLHRLNRMFIFTVKPMFLAGEIIKIFSQDAGHVNNQSKQLFGLSKYKFCHKIDVKPYVETTERWSRALMTTPLMTLSMKSPLNSLCMASVCLFCDASTKCQSIIAKELSARFGTSLQIVRATCVSHQDH